jgi:hypothetical protein
VINTLRPWRRYGHDRLYVSVDDHEIGFREMKGKHGPSQHLGTA